MCGCVCACVCGVCVLDNICWNFPLCTKSLRTVSLYLGNFANPKTELVYLGRDPYLHFKNISSNFSSRVHGFSSLRNELQLETNKLMPATRKGEASFFFFLKISPGLKHP